MKNYVRCCMEKYYLAQMLMIGLSVCLRSLSNYVHLCNIE